MKLSEMYAEMARDEYYEQNAVGHILLDLFLSGASAAALSYLNNGAEEGTCPNISTQNSMTIAATLPLLHAFYVVKQTPGGLKAIADSVYNMLPSFSSKNEEIDAPKLK